MGLFLGDVDILSGVDNGSKLPVGFIGMWSGPIANIPQNWALCDGNNNTPDLTISTPDNIVYIMYIG